MRSSRNAVALVVSLLGLLLSACTANTLGPPVVGDSRGPFDTVRGAAGANEFTALSPEGPRVLEGSAGAASRPPTAAIAATPAAAPPGKVAEASAAPAASAASVATSGVASAGKSGEIRIAIDANAFAAVFGPSEVPVTPSAAQLMQLDSLSLVAADATRVVLQQQILACRRAGDACRLASGH
jgi:hypothetical protein